MQIDPVCSEPVVASPLCKTVTLTVSLWVLRGSGTGGLILEEDS